MAFSGDWPIECRTCAENPAAKDEWACEGGDDEGKYEILDRHPALAQRFGRCPRAYLTGEVGDLLWLWVQWKKGIAPFGDVGAVNQPEALLCVFGLLDDVAEATRADKEPRNGG